METKKEATKNYPHYVIAMSESELSALYISAERYGLDIIGREEIEDRLEATSDFYVN